MIDLQRFYNSRKIKSSQNDQQRLEQSFYILGNSFIDTYQQHLNRINVEHMIVSFSAMPLAWYAYFTIGTQRNAMDNFVAKNIENILIPNIYLQDKPEATNDEIESYILSIENNIEYIQDRIIDLLADTYEYNYFISVKIKRAAMLVCDYIFCQKGFHEDSSLRSIFTRAIDYDLFSVKLKQYVLNLYFPSSAVLADPPDLRWKDFIRY